MVTVRLADGSVQEVKGATWFQFSDGILYLYGERGEGQTSPLFAAFPQANVLSVTKTPCCCQD